MVSTSSIDFQYHTGMALYEYRMGTGVQCILHVFEYVASAILNLRFLSTSRLQLDAKSPRKLFIDLLVYTTAVVYCRRALECMVRPRPPPPRARRRRAVRAPLAVQLYIQDTEYRICILFTQTQLSFVNDYQRTDTLL